jgi:hypothetical protein
MMLIMAALGSGEHLWRVDVVLRRTPASDVHTSDAETTATVDLIRSRLDDPRLAEDEEIFGLPQAAHPYDLPPHEGWIGVSCWVRADDVGHAAQVGHDATVDAARQVTGMRLPLWDLRIVPRTAMMTRSEYGLD